MINLSNLKPAKGSVKNNSRVGRGQGSGGGGTAKRGHNGAKARSGYSQKRGFEGGQMPLQRRVPKFGFNNINRVEYKAINLDTIQSLADNLGVNSIDLGVLYNLGLTQKSDFVKILGRGVVSSPLEVKVNAFSKSAIEAIEKAGGTAIVDTVFNPDASIDLKGKKKSAAKEIKNISKSKVLKTVQILELPKLKSNVKVESATGASKSKIVVDDLKKVEGIGPKIAELLSNGGFDTFAKISIASIEDLQAILDAAGDRYAAHNPSTWSDQATLAAVGKWEELKELQERLNGGRPE
jgi:large subunit ribosomal protein L15